MAEAHHNATQATRLTTEALVRELTMQIMHLETVRSTAVCVESALLHRDASVEIANCVRCHIANELSRIIDKTDLLLAALDSRSQWTDPRDR